MADTTFVYQKTIIEADWLNDVNDFTYNVGQATSWTPQLWDDSNSGAEGQTYGPENAANFFRMGNLVFITGRLDISGLGTLTGSELAQVGNLPYQPVSQCAINIGYAAGLNLAGAYSISGLVSLSEKKFILRAQDLASGGSGLTITELSATADIIFSGWYFTNDPV